jgi:aminodeoxychorismate synthase component I
LTVAVRVALPVRLRHEFWRTFELFEGRRLPFLLDSALASPNLGQHSFLGADPRCVVRARRGDDDGGGDPFAALRRELRATPLLEDAPASVPFRGGAVGYFGYEAGEFVEALAPRPPSALPDVHFGFYDVVLAHHHARGETFACAVGRAETLAGARAEARARAVDLAASVEAFVPSPLAEPDEPRASRPIATPARDPSVVDEGTYAALVERVREHVFAGDVFQACLTHRIETELASPPWPLYRELRRRNPAPFAAYLSMDEGAIASASPERFLRLGQDRIAESRPIKGTRPRGASPAEDEALARELATSEKDAAENTMIVDLVRSDLGRVCRLGSVTVPELRVLERYATVHQLVSTVRGVLDDGKDAIDLVEACFPGGSMTGAPKIEAMNVLTALEGAARGVYSGALGYLDYGGAMDLQIVIRTIVIEGGRAHLGVGGAVVADSDPRAEYRETLDKARALLAAIATANANANVNVSAP